MGYIPKNAKWWIADLVIEFEIEDEGSIVHYNLTLVRANDAEEAYEGALDLGRLHEASYKNPNGHLVTAHFRGLRNLLVVHDDLEHGAELLFEQKEDLTPDQVLASVRRKEDLSVFAPWKDPED
jgi:hypothetical protein